MMEIFKMSSVTFQSVRPNPRLSETREIYAVLGSQLLLTAILPYFQQVLILTSKGVICTHEMFEPQ